MGNVGASNFVMKEVNESPRVQFVVGAVNCVKSTLDEVVIILGEVWDINISVLKPIILLQHEEESQVNPCQRQLHVLKEVVVFLATYLKLTKYKEPTRH